MAETWNVDRGGTVEQTAHLEIDAALGSICIFSRDMPREFFIVMGAKMLWCVISLLVFAPRFVSSQALKRGSSLWYGPSFQPDGWNPNLHFARKTAPSFEYGTDEDDESSWPLDFPECGGKKQSPIDIRAKTMIFGKTPVPLKWKNYDRAPVQMNLGNSGHSLHVTGVWESENETPSLSGGPLSGKFTFSQMHFHWGRNNSVGSEHKVNEKSFPLEMHVVHAKPLKHPVNSTKTHDLAVVGYMFELSRTDNPLLRGILAGADRVKLTGDKKVAIEPFSLGELQLPFVHDYAVYKGSLTTPPCTEGVIWIIDSRPISISSRQLATLRSSIATPSGALVENHRPVQKLNGRSIYYIKSSN